jgi:integrase
MWGKVELKYQCNELFNSYGDGIGTSRHEAKSKAVESGAKGFSEIAKLTKIHSYGTSNTYLPYWKQLAKFAEEKKGITDIREISNRTVKEYLHHKMHGTIKTFSSFSKVIAAVNKMGSTLNKMSEKEGLNKSYEWSKVTDKMRDLGRDKLPTIKEIESDLREKGLSIGRGFIDSQAVVNHINPDKNDFVLAGQMQAETGCRIHEIAVVKQDQLRGLGLDPYTNKEVGVMQVEGKGGKIREVYLSRETYKKIESKVEEKDFKINKSGYTREIKDAAARSGQAYTGTHDFRHSWVQERMKEVINLGFSKSEAKRSTSEEIGHVRPYITETYLKS